MADTRDFHIGDILSITTGLLVSPSHIDGVYRILNWMTGDNLYTHQLPRAWDGTSLTQRTTDHTVGQYLRVNGVALELAEKHDNWIRTSLGRSTVATVHACEIDDPLVLLTSDGVHDQVEHAELEAIVREHQDNPSDLAAAIVAAAREDDDGYRDDATAIVISVARGDRRG